MFAEPSHIIHKEVLEINTGNTMQARNVEKNFKGLLRAITANEIEKCFDDLLLPNEHLVIEKLEINLGIFKKDMLYEELGPRLSVALKKALHQAKSQANQRAHFLRLNGDINDPLNTFSGKKENFSSHIHGQFEIFICYLEKGRLPAWVPLEVELEGDWIKKLIPFQQKTLKEILLKSDQALLRLATRFSDVFIIDVLQHYENRQSFSENLLWLNKRLKNLSSSPAIRDYCWMSSIGSILKLPKNISEEVFFYKIFRNAPPKITAEFILAVKELLKEKEIPPGLEASFQKILEKEKEVKNQLSKDHPGEKRFSDQDALSAREENNSGTYNDLKLTIEKTRMETSEKETNIPAALQKIETFNNNNFPNKELSTKEEVFVDDAGLVILHPFINELFQSCHLLDKGEFKSIESAAKAVNLLAYLAHGVEDLPEYRKLLPKLLCAIAWEIVLPEILPLTEEEKELAQQLLTAVVDHWKALRNSSAEALQETFIRRKGKIFKTSRGLELEVESRTEDILLTRLPWGFSMVKLKWMPGILYVTWN